MVFGKEVTAAERNEKMPEWFTCDQQQQTKLGELLKENSEAEEKEEQNAKKKKE